MSKYKGSFEIKALEPKRWWHYLGFKRKIVGTNVNFTCGNVYEVKFSTTISNETFEVSDFKITDLGG